ncbi:MAG: hypothetical protein Tsb002_18170 [Wenzhouxiangellaceae bacterium]
MKHIDLEAVPARSWWTLITLVWLLPAAILAGMYLFSASGRLQLAQQLPLLTYLAIIFLISGLIPLWMMRHNSATIDNRQLRLRAARWFKRQVALDQIDWPRAAHHKLSGNSDQRPRWRTFGIGLPGYACGYFRLRDKTSAFAMLIGDEFVYLPLRDGKAVLFSPQKPQQWLRQAQRDFADHSNQRQ